MANENRLIDAVDTVTKISKKVQPLLQNGCSAQELYDAVLECIAEAPTVDAVEVVHGRWIFGTANHREYMKCSVCLKSQTPTGVFTYCPNCGAKMDGEK